VKFVLEGALGLYSIFGIGIVLGILEISSYLAIRAGARNISSMHTGRQVGPDIRYKIPSLAVIALESVEFNLVKIYASAFTLMNIKGAAIPGFRETRSRYSNNGCCPDQIS
jgi:hypothetical protein